MMTPVYDVAIADWKTNSCNIFTYVVRLANSVVPTKNSTKTCNTRSPEKHLFICQSQHLKKHFWQRFHITASETGENVSPVKRQQSKRKLSTPYTTPSKQRHFHFSSNSKTFCLEVNPTIYRDFLHSGTDVLWPQAKFELMLTKSESNVLQSYIKEQPAVPHTTTATDEEK